MKNKVEKELNKRNKRFDFKGLFKNFVAGAQEELSQKQVIMNDPTLSMQEKKLLIECLDKEEIRASQMNIDEVVHSEERKTFGTVRNNKKSKYDSKKETNESNKDIENVNSRIATRSHITNQRQQGR